MINETKSTFANEWCLGEGCKISLSAVILAFFTGTFSLTNKIHAVQLYIKLNHLVLQRKGITGIGLNSDFFSTVILWVHCLHFNMQIDVTFQRFKENLA